MEPIASILAATDFSDCAGRATRRAALLAKSLGAQLELLHVVSAPALADLRLLAPGAFDAEALVLTEARRRMDEASAALGATAGQVQAGESSSTILAAAGAHDLLVLGHRGSGSIREAFLGSTAERLLLRAERPMLVVKREPDAAYRRILVPCEYAPPARRALEAALRFAPGAHVTLVHAYELDFEASLWRVPEAQEQMAQWRARAEERTRGWLEGLGKGLPGADKVDVLAVHGKPRAVLPALVASTGADLVVMGKQGRSRVREAFLGSVSRQVLIEADCDVMVVPPGE